MCAWLHMCPSSKSHLCWPIPLPFWSSPSELSEKLSGNPQTKLKLTDLTGHIFMCRQCLYPFCLTRTPWGRSCHGVHFVDSQRECRGKLPKAIPEPTAGATVLWYSAPRVPGADDGRERKKCYFHRTNRRWVQTRVRYYRWSLGYKPWTSPQEKWSLRASVCGYWLCGTGTEPVRASLASPRRRRRRPEQTPACDREHRGSPA